MFTWAKNKIKYIDLLYALKSESFSLSWLFSFQNVLCLVDQSCLTLWTPQIVVCQAPLSMGILQARILEWVSMLFSRGSSQPRD